MNHDSIPDLAARLARRVRVSRGDEPGDVLLTGGHVVNVFNGFVQPANVVIADGMIAGVGSRRWDAVITIDVDGGIIAPGLIDAHMHIESTLLMPAALAAVVVPRGTSAIVADPHEIANVLGTAGIHFMLDASEHLPCDCFFMAPSCVPASPFERAGATLEAADLAPLLAHERVLGLGEMMNFPGVLAGDTGVMAKLAAAHAAGRVVDGHAPGLVGDDISTYAAAGIRSDHECTTPEEALARADLGMLVQIREGSMARNLDAFLPLLREGRLGDWCLCTDDIHPEDLLADGHLDGLLRRLVAAGIDAATALRHASLVPARHYGLRDRGAVTPGFRADLAVFADLVDFRATHVLHRGHLVAEHGTLVEPPRDAAVAAPDNTVRVGTLAPEDFDVARVRTPRPIIGIVPDQIVTTRETDRAGSDWTFDPSRDVVPVACVQRHDGSGTVGLGFVRGFGFAHHGALGSSVGHDAHNLLVAGTNPADMHRCVRALADMGGGFAAVRDGEVLAALALPVAGLMSTADVESVCRDHALVNAAAAELGCPLHAPFGTLSFLGLTVIPALRITDAGVFDVERFALV